MMRSRTASVSMFLAALLAVSIPRQSVARLISPWITNADNGHSYALLDRNNWISSEIQAVSMGAHLTTINDQAEQDWVYKTFGGYNGRNRLLWIGLADGNRTSQFAWANREPVTYTHWAPGEPNGGGRERFVAMFYPGHSRQSRWNDWGFISRDPIGLPLNGVVEMGDTPYTPSFALGRDADWLAIAPEGNQEGRPITSVGAAFEAANPGWNTDLAYDASAWGPIRRQDAHAMWGPGVDTPVYFRSTLTLDRPVEHAVVLFGVDDDLQVYINGSIVRDDRSGRASGYGPIDVAEYLVEGDNLIALKAHDSYGIGQSVEFFLHGEVVPEPSTLALLAAAVVALAGFAWRRRATDYRNSRPYQSG